MENSQIIIVMLAVLCLVSIVSVALLLAARRGGKGGLSPQDKDRDETARALESMRAASTGVIKVVQASGE